MSNLFNELITSNPLLRATDVKRYSGVDCIRSEDILQHTSQVSLISYILALRCKQYGDDINIGILLEKCLVHDIDESLTGDIPRPIKYYSKQVLDGIHSLAEESASRLTSRVFKLDEDLTSRVVQNLNECKYGVEGIFVKISDLLSVAYKVYEEVMLLNNKKFLKVSVESVIYLSELLEYINDNASTKGLSNDSVVFLSDLIADSILVLKSINSENRAIISQMNLDNYDFVNHE